MGGGVIQLIAYGRQDVHLCGNPQITFFKAVYKRHTNFALETFSLLPRGTPGFNNRLRFDIERKADLLGNTFLTLYLTFKKDDGTACTFKEVKHELSLNLKNSMLAKSLGYAMISYIEIEIGGTRIDKHSGEYLAIHSQTVDNFNKRFNLYRLAETITRAPHMGPSVFSVTVPLQFWFTENPGMFLPLVALQHHDVKIFVKLACKNHVILSATGDRTPDFEIADIEFIETHLNCTYAFLDTPEQKKFAHTPHEYLVQQVQELPSHEYVSGVATDINIVVPLNLNHPVKTIAFTLHDYKQIEYGGILWSGEKYRIKNALIQLNGVDRFDARDSDYFQTIQQYYHTNSVNFHGFCEELQNLVNQEIFDTEVFSSVPTAAVDPFVYSFGLFHNKHQPTGSCNFSKIDNAVLKFSTCNNTDTGIGTTTMDEFGTHGFYVNVYAINYNILSIKKGMGLLVYTN